MATFDQLLESGRPRTRLTLSSGMHRLVRGLRTAIRYFVILGVALAIIVFGAVSIVTTFFTVRSDYAAVASSWYRYGSAKPVGRQST